jgi:hypothetical protein
MSSRCSILWDFALSQGSALLDAHGRSAFYVCAMKKAGYVMLYCSKTTQEFALKWLAAHPNFRTSEYGKRGGVAA